MCTLERCMCSSVKISFRNLIFKSLRMRLSLLFVLLLVVNVVDPDEVKSVSVMEGNSVTLHTDLTEIRGDDLILWMFGPQETPIAEIYQQNISIYNDERFRDKLMLDNRTGSLTITNISITNSGLYQLLIMTRNRTSFNVTVTAPLPTPTLTRLLSASNNPSQCQVRCSVSDVQQVLLSLYKGTNLVSSSSCSGFSQIFSLSIEVDYQDPNTYICSVSNQNDHRNMTIKEPCVICKGAEGTKIVPVIAGVSLTLQADQFDKEAEDDILWTFTADEHYIAKMKKSTHDIRIYESFFFKDAFLNNDTGSLTIPNIREEHTGLYKRIVLDQGKIKCWIFNVTVYAPLFFFPNITMEPSIMKMILSSRCVLLCSVMNVSHVSLSWYKGKSLLSSISVSDLNIRLSLPLEVEYQDTNTYRCVVSNPVSNQTQYVNVTEVCRKCAEESNHLKNLIVCVVVVLALLVVILIVILITKKLCGNGTSTEDLLEDETNDDLTSPLSPTQHLGGARGRHQSRPI
ncbi:uncharacterized protein LOC130548624 [Triplophysa rosa]|uniref:uncharacterized protein LOC130548624 n=1 Tax=Triplophysa rosa TaxID=992332 RepID=UPI002546222E|nr:uncharacterized protein LOC130548624 [Triplophysa rosa]